MTRFLTDRAELSRTAGAGSRALAACLACASLSLLAAGCGETERALVIQNEAEFQTAAVQETKPVLVMFFKQGCASCAALEPAMDELASEYKGRAVVAKFMVLTFTFGVPSPELKERYGVVFVPHVVLLVGGKEKGHWITEYSKTVYQNALNEALAQSHP